jgi:glycosyltransferase involved in cell wall biosynthesis
VSPETHVVLNALANTGAGAFNVARQLAAHLGPVKPDWRFTLLLVGDFALHDQVTPQSLPANVTIRRAPAVAQHRVGRMKFERQFWPQFVREQHVSASLQLNGFMPPGVTIPVVAHNQDPWPYRPEAWDMGFPDRVIAFLRRRAHARAMKRADIVGFTSNYLRELMIRQLGITPKRSRVFYNGLPESWLARAAGPLPAWRDRPMELLSVSSVGLYKRQELVIRALPDLLKRPGMKDLVYRVLGHHNNAQYVAGMKKLADDLGVGKRVIVEGRVPDERVEETMQQARAYVLMSVCESFGLPAIEAMSFGTPTVISNCCAHPEVGGDGAVLSPVDDIPVLTDNLHRVLTDEAFSEALRQRGAKNIQRFRWSETAAQMAEALQEIAT